MVDNLDYKKNDNLQNILKLLGNRLPLPEIGELLTVRSLKDLEIAKNGKDLVPLMVTPVIDDANKERYAKDFGLVEGNEYTFFIPWFGREYINKYIKEANQNISNCLITIEIKEWKDCPPDKTSVERDLQGRAKNVVITNVIPFSDNVEYILKDVEKHEIQERVSIFTRLNEKYGQEEVVKRINEVAEIPTTDEFYRWTKEQVLIKQPPSAVYSPTRFKFSDDGWGFVGNLQRVKDVESGKITGETALVYPFGLSEPQFWSLVGNVKGVFPQWTSGIDPVFEITSGLVLDVNDGAYDFTKPDGSIEQRKKVRFSVVKDGVGKDGYQNRLTWLKNKIEKYPTLEEGLKF